MMESPWIQAWANRGHGVGGWFPLVDVSQELAKHSGARAFEMYRGRESIQFNPCLFVFT